MTAGLRPDAVLETVLYAENLEAVSDFYGWVLNLPLVHEDGRMKAHRVSAQSLLLLFRSGASRRPVPVPGGTIPPHDGAGGMHVAFAVAPGAMASWRRRLRDHDIPIEARVTWPSGAESLYFRDPAGNLVELAPPDLWRGRGRARPADTGRRETLSKEARDAIVKTLRGMISRDVPQAVEVGLMPGMLGYRRDGGEIFCMILWEQSGVQLRFPFCPAIARSDDRFEPIAGTGACRFVLRRRSDLPDALLRAAIRSAADGA
ncbi:MAG: VOC family protein [Roseicyclus sp.]